MLIPIERPWGRFFVLWEEPGMRAKKIEVDEDKRFSLQRHAHRGELWYIIDGYGFATVGKTGRKVITGDSVEIQVGQVHRMENVGKGKLVFFELQHGDVIDESDVERLEDDFGRETGGKVEK